MGETTKEWMRGQSTDIWDRGVGDSRYLFHDRDIFEKMVMKGGCPNDPKRTQRILRQLRMHRSNLECSEWIQQTTKGKNFKVPKNQ
jgi:hypothetical protein